MSDSRLAGKSSGRAQVFWTGVATTLTLLVLAMIVPAALEKAANVTYDFQVSRLPRRGASAAPVIVEVDERSLALFGQWPWPRYRLARLLDALAQSGATAVGIDAMFPERDRSSPTEVQQELRQGFGHELSLERVPEGVRNYDRILAASLASGPFVLGYAFRFGDEFSPNCSPRSANAAVVSRTASSDSLEGLHRAKGASCSIPILGEAASAGFVNSRPDDDGIYRRTPLIIEWNGRVYPSLAVQTLLTSAHLDQMVVESHAEGYTLRLGSRAVPLDKAGNLLLRFRGPGRTFEYISAADVLSGHIAKDRLQGRIVFVGVTALGLTEYRPTVFDPLFSGVEIHATIVDNILRQDFLQRPTGGAVVAVASAFMLGSLLSVAMAYSGALVGMSTAVLLALAPLFASQVVLTRTGLVIAPGPSIVTVVLVLLVLSLFKYGVARRLASAMRHQILLSQEATIDGFGAMAEYRDPETGAHIRRTQMYIRALAEHLRGHPRFRRDLDDSTIQLIYKAAPLHDIGKIGVPDRILLKPGPLSKAEFDAMKQHTVFGARVIGTIEARVGGNDFLRIAKEIILYHHEKWDGSGYPQGLVGCEIPVSARLMAVADVYDALISRRVYKPPFSHSVAVRMVLEGKGTHFDPDVVDAFAELESGFRDIALRSSDSVEQYGVVLNGDTTGRESTRPADA